MRGHEERMKHGQGRGVWFCVRTLDGSPGHRDSGVPLESGKWGAVKCDSYENAF